MKPTDYAPRTTFFDTFLTGEDLTGIEVGADVGAHAESILTYSDIKKLYLVDLWENDYCKGYCEGRLRKWKYKTVFLKGEASEIASNLNIEFDFVYVDIANDYKTIKQSISDWWPKIKEGGILGFRNYNICSPAIDQFLLNGHRSEKDSYYNEIVIFK